MAVKREGSRNKYSFGMDPSINQALLLSVIELADRIDRRASAALSSIKGISLAEYRLLRALADAPNAQASRVSLAEAVGLTASGVTRALVPLEKIGYVETVRDERDARKALASLTVAGEELVADASGVLNDHTAGITMGSTQANEVLDLLANLAGGARRV